MRAFAYTILGLGALAACGQITAEQAADRCEDRARAAQGPEVEMIMGVSRENGAFGGASVGISLDALQGRDPQAVYESCVMNLTGETPIRPVQLRDM
ncbi:hypothetical protein [Yoonia sp.]|uniref:hypothetical protein n=1 Tax=Yoonia sp. TaxID=2212373 RepID=UPI0035C7AD66